MAHHSDQTEHRIRQGTIAIIGNRSMTCDEVLRIAQHISQVCGHNGGIDKPISEIADQITAHYIPEQIID